MVNDGEAPDPSVRGALPDAALGFSAFWEGAWLQDAIHAENKKVPLLVIWFTMIRAGQ